MEELTRTSHMFFTNTVQYFAVLAANKINIDRTFFSIPMLCTLPFRPWCGRRPRCGRSSCWFPCGDGSPSVRPLPQWTEPFCVPYLSVFSVDAVPDAVNLLVDFRAVMVALLSGPGHGELNPAGMPCSNTRNLPQTLVRLPWQLLTVPPGGHTCKGK